MHFYAKVTKAIAIGRALSKCRLVVQESQHKRDATGKVSEGVTGGLFDFLRVAHVVRGGAPHSFSPIFNVCSPFWQSQVFQVGF